MVVTLRKKKEEIQNWKKGKLKVKTFLKTTILDEQEPSVQLTDRTRTVQIGSWGNMYIHQNPPV